MSVIKRTIPAKDEYLLLLSDDQCIKLTKILKKRLRDALQEIKQINDKGIPTISGISVEESKVTKTESENIRFIKEIITLMENRDFEPTWRCTGCGQLHLVGEECEE